MFIFTFQGRGIKNLLFGSSFVSAILEKMYFTKIALF